MMDFDDSHTGILKIWHELQMRKKGMEFGYAGFKLCWNKYFNDECGFTPMNNESNTPIYDAIMKLQDVKTKRSDMYTKELEELEVIYTKTVEELTKEVEHMLPHLLVYMSKFVELHNKKDEVLDRLDDLLEKMGKEPKQCTGCFDV